VVVASKAVTGLHPLANQTLPLVQWENLGINQ